MFSVQQALESKRIREALLLTVGTAAGAAVLLMAIQQDAAFELLAAMVAALGALLFWRWLTAAIWRPALVLLFQVALQAILFVYLGILANLLTWFLIFAFLWQVPASELVKTLLGTRTQVLAFIFIYFLSYSVLLAGLSVDVLIDYSQIVTLLFIVAALRAAFMTPKFESKAVWAVTISMAIMLFLAILEHYFDIRIIKQIAKNASEPSNIHRMTGPAGTFSINRLAFMTILPITLGISMLLSEHAKLRPIARLALICLLSILAFGLLSTGSRGGIAGVVAATALIWLRIQRKVATGLALAFVATVAVIVLVNYVPIDVFTRSTGTTVLASADIRVNTWGLAFEQFVKHPILGVGWEQLKPTLLREYPMGIYRTAFTAHNSLLDLLSESGLVGTIPFLVLCSYVMVRLWRSGAIVEAGRAGIWRLAAIAGFVGMFQATMTSAYHFDRFFWIPIAFAAYLDTVSNGPQN